MTTPSNARCSNPRLRAVRVEIGQDVRNYTSGPQRVTTVPLTIRRRQNRKLLIPPPGAESVLDAGGLDRPMIKTLGKAFYWQRLLDEGQHAGSTALAQALKLDAGWVAEVLRLTLLAPDIVEAIIEGRQPRHISLQALRGRADQITRDWAQQRQVLGFAARPD